MLTLTYVVNDSCIRCKTMDCVEVCPVDCFYEGENMLVIHPDECIDCGLVRQRSKADGRSVSLRLTSKGKKALARDPFEVLVRAVDLLDVKKQTAMHHALHQVLTTLAASGAHRRFGVCQDCMYLNGETRCNLTSASSSTPECLLLGVPIEPEDVDLLCVHFR